MDKLTLVVLAAGIGSRYGGLKQVDPMGPSGEIILDYSVYDALRAGFSKVVFVISKAIEEVFRERVGKTIERQVETAYAFQRLDDVPAGFEVPAGRVKPWGTAHAVFASRDIVDTPFVALNADDYYGRTAYQTIADYLRHTSRRHVCRRGLHPADGVADYCMVGYHVGNTLTEHGHVARAVCTVDADGYLLHAQERTRIERQGDAAAFTEDGETWTRLPLDTIVSMNMWGFTPDVYARLAEHFPRFLAPLWQAPQHVDIARAEFYIPNFVADLIHAGQARVKVLATTERWHGVTYSQDKPLVKAAIRELVAAGVYPENLWGSAE